MDTPPEPPFVSMAAAISPARRMSLGRMVFQLVGFALCLGLLGFVVYRAFTRPESAEQLERLRDAHWWQVAVLLVCSFATVVIGGLVFAVVLRPQRHLRTINVVAINGVVSVISYLPFKLGLAFRIGWHIRRDGISPFTMFAWLAATALLILASIAPPLAASLWRGKIDALWIATGLLGMVIVGSVVVLSARAFAGQRGLKRIADMVAVLRIGFLNRLVASPRFGVLQSGTAMLASAPTVAKVLVLRTLDLAAQATRLYVAAQVCGVPLDPSQAVLAGSTYFFLQAVAPTGVAGVREGGTVGLMTALGVPDLTVVVLTASLAEVIANVVMAAAGGLWLRWAGASGKGVAVREGAASAVGAGASPKPH